MRWLDGITDSMVRGSQAPRRAVCGTRGSLRTMHGGGSAPSCCAFIHRVVVKNPPVNAGDAGDVGLIPGSGRCPREGHGNQLQYSCLENPMDRGAWWATVHGVTKSWTRLSNQQTRTHTHEGFPGGSDGKKSVCNEGDVGSIPGSGRSPGERNGNLLQYSCLKNPHGQRSLTGYVQRVTKSRTLLSN